MEIEDRDNKINSTNENAKIRQKRRIIILILLALIVLLVSLTCGIFDDDDVATESWDKRVATGVKSTELVMKKTVDFYQSTEARGTFFAPTQTAFWSTQGPELTQFAKSLKQTDDAIRATQWAIITVQEATMVVERKNYYNGLKTQTEEATPKPPVINDIDFPSLIPKTGEAIRGTLYFSDPNGDVVSQNVEVVSATGPGFTGITRNIRDRLVTGTWFNGAIWFGFHCFENQDVTVRMTLIDRKGNVSNPKNLSFSCR